MLRTIGAKA